MRFNRNPPLRFYKHYRRYRKYTQHTFCHVCAYCFRHEDEAGGEEHFEQDHFKPASRPDVDPADYRNLYWSCRGCNSRENKGNNWPSPEQEARDERFCDPCKADPVGRDYTEDDDGRLVSLTPAGRYTIRRIRLNERKCLVECRVRRTRLRSTYRTQLQMLRQAVETVTQASVQSALAELIESYERFVSREPFMMVSIPPEVTEELMDLARAARRETRAD